MVSKRIMRSPPVPLRRLSSVGAGGKITIFLPLVVLPVLGSCAAAGILLRLTRLV